MLDMRSRDLLRHLESLINSDTTPGKVLACIIIPDYGKLFKYERQRLHLLGRNRTLQGDPPFFKFLVRKEYLNEEALQKELQKLDYLVDSELTKEITASHSAFVVLDSMRAVYRLMNKSSSNTSMTKLNDGIKEGFNRYLVDAMEDSEDLEDGRKDLNLLPPEDVPANPNLLPQERFRCICTPFAHSSDINWRCVRNKATRNAFFKIIATLLSLVILLFMTSPAAIIRPVVRYLPFLQFVVETSWADKSNVLTRFIFKTVLPALIVISVNELLLLLIEILVDYEYNHRFSIQQKSILRKSFIYYLFNMLIVPACTNFTISNLYELLRANLSGGLNPFQQMFQLKSGDFFVVLLIQSGGGALLSQLNSMGLLFRNYLSPKITLRTQELVYFEENWRKDETTLFNYGHFYAQMSVAIGIACVF
jgi:hypothetical protein